MKSLMQDKDAWSLQDPLAPVCDVRLGTIEECIKTIKKELDRYDEYRDQNEYLAVDRCVDALEALKTKE